MDASLSSRQTVMLKSTAPVRTGSSTRNCSVASRWQLPGGCAASARSIVDKDIGVRSTVMASASARESRKVPQSPVPMTQEKKVVYLPL